MYKQSTSSVLIRHVDYVYANFLQFSRLSCKHVSKFCNGITLEDNLGLFQGYV